MKRVIAYNALVFVLLVLLVTIPMFPSAQAAFTWSAYYLSLPVAKIPSAAVEVRAVALKPDGSRAEIAEIAIVWLASPRNNFTSAILHRGRGDRAVVLLPRVHLGRVSSIDAYGRVSWVDLYNVENLLVMVVATDGSFGAKVVGLEVASVAATLQVEVKLASRLPGGAAMLSAATATTTLASTTWYWLVEWEEQEKISAFATLYPDEGVKIELYIPQGKALWFESKSRSAPSYSELPSASWTSGTSGVNTPAALGFDSWVPAPGGGAWIRLGTKVVWRYERWERYDNGALTQVIEVVFPADCKGGIYYVATGSYTPPSVSGNTMPVGDPGAYVIFSIDGVWQFKEVAATVGFSVTYPTGEATVGLSLRFVIKYEAATVKVAVMSAARDPLRYSVIAFDRGTSWGEVYTAWVPD